MGEPIINTLTRLREKDGDAHAERRVLIEAFFAACGEEYSCLALAQDEARCNLAAPDQGCVLVVGEGATINVRVAIRLAKGDQYLVFNREEGAVDGVVSPSDVTQLSPCSCYILSTGPAPSSPSPPAEATASSQRPEKRPASDSALAQPPAQKKQPPPRSRREYIKRSKAQGHPVPSSADGPDGETAAEPVKIPRTYRKGRRNRNRGRGRKDKAKKGEGAEGAEGGAPPASNAGPSNVEPSNIEPVDPSNAGAVRN